MATIPFEKGAGFDGKRMMKDIAFHMAGCREMNLASADRTDHMAAHDGFFSPDFAVHNGLFANREGIRIDVALNLAVDLNIAGRVESANDRHI